MAKKDEFGLGNDDLDDLNFDDMDFGDLDSGMSGNDKRKPIEFFKDTLKSTAKSKLTDPGFIRRMIMKVVPKGYAQAFDAYDALDATVADIMKDNASELTPLLLKTKQKMDRMNPTLRRMLPKSVRDAADAADAPTSHDSGPDELTSNIDGIDKLLGFQAKQAMETEYKGVASELRDKKRFTAEMKVSTAMAKGIGRLVGYQDTVLVNYHRKSIEIGYRQLDVGIRTLKLHQEYYHTSGKLLKDILKNTGLPDFLKMKTTEVVEQQLKQRLAGAAMKGVGGAATKFFGGIGKNLSDMTGEALQFHSQLSEGAEMGISKSQMAGTILGSLAAEFLGDKAESLLGGIAKKYKGKIAGNSVVKKGDNFLRSALSGIFQKANDYAKSDTDYDGKYYGVHDFFKGMIGTHSAARNIKGNGIMDLDTPAQFDTLFHKSVTEIIPAHLASIDRWVKTMATGKDQEETKFSHYTGSLVKKSTLNQQHLKLALKEGGPNVRASVDEVLAEIDAKELSPEARRALRLRLLGDMQEGTDFKPEKYVTLKSWEGTDPSVANEIIELFQDKFQIDKVTGTFNGNDDHAARLNDVRDKYLSTQQGLPDYGVKMGELSSATGRKAWRDLGLTKYNGGQSDTIDLKALHSLLLEGDETDLVKKEKKDETTREKAVRLQEEDRAKKLKATQMFELDDDESGLKGSFAGSHRRATAASVAPSAPIKPSIAPPPLQTQSHIVMPDSIKAVVEFPDLFKVSDEETHKRLDAMLGMAQKANQFLDYLSHKASGAGEAGEAPGAGDAGPEAKKRRWRDYSIGDATRHGLKAGGLAGKGVFNYLKTSYGLMWKGGKLGAKVGVNAAKLPFARIPGFGISDVHVVGDEDPSLTAKGIRKGLYMDANTQKVITKIADITGAVKDQNGNEVLSQEEFEKGLVNGKGQSLAGLGLKLGMKATGIAAKVGAAYFGGTYGLMWKGIKALTNFAVNQFTQFDAYFPGDTEPRIRSSEMKKGKYRQADGTPIFTLKDVKGPVFEMNDKGEMNEIISQEDIDKYKSFYTRNGSLLFTIGKGFFKVGTKAAELAAKAALAYGKFALKMYKGIWDIGKKALGGVRKFTTGRFGKNGGIGMLDEEMAAASIEISVEQLKVQTGIYDLLRKQFNPKHVLGDDDGDGVADNSWKDILKRRAAKMAGKGGKNGNSADSEAIVDAVKNMNKDLDKKLDTLIETTHDAGEESLLDEVSDLADLKGHGKGGRGRVKPKGGFKSGRGLRGKVGNIASKGWNLAKKIPGAGKIAKYGSKLAPAGRWLGRGALAAAEFLPGAGAIAEGAAVAGGAIMTAGSAVLGGAAAVGSAIVGTLGLPLIIGAAVLGGAAYLGYKYYKSEQAKKFPLLYLRMTQYGVAPTNGDRVQQVLQLEALCKGAVSVTKDGKATMDPKSIDAAAFLKLFPTDGAEHEHNLMKWVATRFRPVYLAHCSAMQAIRGTTALVSADDSIGDGDIANFLQIVDMGGMQKVYDDTSASPFDGSLDCDSGDVAKAVQMVKDRRKDKADAKVDTAKMAAATGNAAVLAANTTLSVAANGKSPDDIAKGLVLAPSMVGGFRGTTQVGNNLAKRAVTALDIPTAVRYKTYGLRDLALDKAQQLQAVEEVYWDVVQFSGNDKAMMGGNVDDLMMKVMTIFKPADGQAHEDTVRWLNYRFIPTFLQYNISVRRRFNGAVKDAARNLTGTLMKEVLTETTQTQSDSMLGKVSVWSITNSPWVKYDLETLPGSVTLYLDGIDTSNASKVLTVSGLKDQKASVGQDYGTRLSDIALGNTQNNGNRGNVGATAPTLQNMGKVFKSGAVPGGVTGQSTTGQGTGALLQSGPVGVQVEHPGGGSGGDINKIPSATGKGWPAMKPVIEGAAALVGFDPKIGAAVAGIESRFDPSASSGVATGLYQFVSGTWKMMIAKYGAKYGIDANTPPTDARANAIMGMCYLKENYEGLSKTLGGNVSDVDLYCAHFLGLGGARQFLTAPRGDPADQHVSAGAVKNNASVFKDKSGRMRTVGETLQELDRRIDIGRKASGQATSGAKGPTEVAKPGVGSSSGSGIPEDGGGVSAAAKPGATPGPSGPSLEADGATSVGGAMAAKGALGGAAAGAAAASGAAAGSSGTSAITTGSTSAAAVAEIKGTEGQGTGAVAPAAAVVPPATSATASMANAAQQSSMAQHAAASTDLSGLMQQMVTVSTESGQTLKAILAAIGASKPVDATPAAGAQTPPKAEPGRRNPLDTKRANAVT